MRQLLILMLLIPCALQAEVYNCNGVWTDQPCAATAEGFNKPNFKIDKGESDGAIKPAEQPRSETRQLPRAEQPIVQKTVTPTPQPTTAVSPQKSFYVSSMTSMNKACGNQFSIGELRSLEQYCKDSDTSEKDCGSRWAGMQAELLQSNKADKCRKAVFDASNRADKF